MPIINNLEQQFSSLSTSESPQKAATAPALISPAKSEADASIFSSSDDEASQDGTRMLVKKTEHKLQEEQGLMDDEPLLKENPYRFVLFPIEDNEVRFIPKCPKLATNVTQTYQLTRRSFTRSIFLIDHSHS